MKQVNCKVASSQRGQINCGGKQNSAFKDIKSKERNHSCENSRSAENHRLNFPFFLPHYKWTPRDLSENTFDVESFPSYQSLGKLTTHRRDTVISFFNSEPSIVNKDKEGDDATDYMTVEDEDDPTMIPELNTMKEIARNGSVPNADDYYRYMQRMGRSRRATSTRTSEGDSSCQCHNPGGLMLVIQSLMSLVFQI